MPATRSRLAQTSESNVEPEERITPTTIQVRPPSGNVSPTSSRSRFFAAASCSGLRSRPSSRAIPSPITA